MNDQNKLLLVGLVVILGVSIALIINHQKFDEPENFEITKEQVNFWTSVICNKYDGQFSGTACTLDNIKYRAEFDSYNNLSAKFQQKQWYLSEIEEN